MRSFWIIVAVVLIPPLAVAQGPIPESELEHRVEQLEQQVAELKNALRAFQSVEARLRMLELIVGSAGDGVVQSPASKRDPSRLEREAFPSMPYGDEQTFVVTAVRKEGRVSSRGIERYIIEVDVVELPVDAVEGLTKTHLQDYRYFSLPVGLPEGSRRFLVVLEDLDLGSAEAWALALKPVRESAGDQEIMLFRAIRFERVPTSQTHRQGYTGNSGTVRAWRGQITWYENNIIFLDDGVLRLVGPPAARYHLTFVKH